MVSKLASAAYAGLFPVFFAYHALAAFEVLTVPLPLGGLWMPINALVAVVVGAAMVPHVLSNIERHLWFIVLVAIMAALVAYHYVENSNPFDRTISVVESGKLIVAFVSLYSIGFFIRGDGRFKWATLVVLALMAVVVPFLIQTDPFSPLDDDRRRFNGEVASYAWFATAVVFTGMAAFAFSVGVKQKALVVGLTLFSLLLVGGRSELVGFVFALCLLVGGSLIKSRTIPWRGLLMAGALIVAAVAASSVTAPDVFGRYAEMLDLSQSRSWQERLAALSVGIGHIANNPLFGSYGAYIRSEQDFGLYIHNALSMWAQFGIAAFCLYGWLCVRSFYISGLALWRGRDDGGQWLFAFMVSAFCLLLIVLAKSVFWPLPALAWGLVAGASNRSR